MPGLDLLQEADRQLKICNACRYCEGYCPVFQAIETRREFGPADVYQLAHLCHDCRACYYACMYTTPHGFAINIPSLLSEVRVTTYRRWSWPAMLGRAFGDQRIGVTVAALAAAAVIVVTAVLVGPQRLFTSHKGPGAFYEIIPYLAMVVPAVALFFYGLAIWLRGTLKAWSETGGSGDGSQPVGSDLKSLLSAIGAALSLRYLKGGGPGCFYPDERPSAARRVCHGLVFWGFLATFASTTLAYIYQDLLHWLPPYPLFSAPVIFGSAGGVGLIAGTAGLIWFKRKSDAAPANKGATGMDYVFLIVLGMAALTGMLTLAFRSTPALGTLLTLHLASVAALFASAPYGKFVHFLYRSLALLRYSAEQHSPKTPGKH